MQPPSYNSVAGEAVTANQSSRTKTVGPLPKKVGARSVIKRNQRTKRWQLFPNSNHGWELTWNYMCCRYLSLSRIWGIFRTARRMPSCFKTWKVRQTLKKKLSLKLVKLSKWKLERLWWRWETALAVWSYALEMNRQVKFKLIVCYTLRTAMSDSTRRSWFWKLMISAP